MTGFYSQILQILIIMLSSFFIILKTENKKIKLFYFLFVFIFFCFQISGTDIESYRKIFENPKSADTLEPIIKYLIRILNYFNLDYSYFQIIISLICMVVLCKIIQEKELSFIQFNTFILFYITSAAISSLRQMPAALLYLLTLKFYSEKKKTKGKISLLTSFFFHFSSFILFPILILLKKNITRKKYIYLILLAIFSGFFIKSELYFLISLLNIEEGIVAFKIKNYMTPSQSFKNPVLIIGILGMLLINHMIINLSYKRKNNIFKKNLYLSLIKNSIIIGNVIQVFFIALGLTLIGSRFVLSIQIGNFVLLSYLKGNKKVIFILLMISNLLLFLVNAGIESEASTAYKIFFMVKKIFFY